MYPLLLLCVLLPPARGAWGSSGPGGRAVSCLPSRPALWGRGQPASASGTLRADAGPHPMSVQGTEALGHKGSLGLLRPNMTN